MANRITIEPVTRIEGHARIQLHLGEDGRVEQAYFQVTQFRGFEHFVQGRPFAEMPALMARICGICPVSHELASAKACDQILAVAVPETALALRRLLNLGQLIQSHALSFFYLSAPDLMLGMDHPAATRNFFGLAERDPQFARDGIRLRQFGQQLIERVAGKRIHPAWVVPGGVSSPLAPDARDAILAGLPAIKDLAFGHLQQWKSRMEAFAALIPDFAHFPSLFMGIAGPEGQLEHYDGQLQIIDVTGMPLATLATPGQYSQYIGEAAEPWTYLKFPYFLPHGYPGGMYRVGPMARLNIARSCGTELAGKEFAVWRELGGSGPVLGSFYNHYARLIELLFAVEQVEQLLDSPAILDTRVRANAGVNAQAGIGISEAPRGTLIHHYQVDEHGLMQKANLIIATGHNNLAMHRGILQAAQHQINQGHLDEGALNTIEAVIRAFDPCLACSTHAVGSMPLIITLYDHQGLPIDEVHR